MKIFIFLGMTSCSVGIEFHINVPALGCWPILFMFFLIMGYDKKKLTAHFQVELLNFHCQQIIVISP